MGDDGGRLRRAGHPARSRGYPHLVTTFQDAATARELPPGLWDRLRLDPIRSPEHIALAASKTFAPQAQQWAEEKRSRYAVQPVELARMAK